MASEASLTERLAQRLAQPVAAHDRARAAWHLLDWMACALAGRGSPTGQALARVVAGAPNGACWLAGFDDRGAQAAEAAFLHGGLGSVFELDDLHRAAIVHAGDTVVPAALAVAQREGAGARALLDAIVRGYEAAIVVGRLAGPRHYRHWYSTATCGVFGAAAACASLLNLSPESTADALGLAGMQASGPWQCREEPGFAKQFATAHAARSGVWAADMALGGVSGPRRILEGRHGLLAATGASLQTEPVQAFESACARGSDPAARRGEAESSRPPGVAEERLPQPTGAWQIHDVSFKPWPACRHVHPAIEAAIALRARLGDVAPAIDDALAAVTAIDVETYADALAFADRPQPSTDHEARFSLQHAVAVALCRGDFTLPDATAIPREDPVIAVLRDKVRVKASPRFDAAYPARFGSAVTVQWRDRDDAGTRSPGRGAEGPDAAPGPSPGDSRPPKRLSVSVDAALGDPEHPMSTQALRWKAATLLDHAGLGSQQGQELIRACLGLIETDGPAGDRERDLEPLWRALRSLGDFTGEPQPSASR